MTNIVLVSKASDKWRIYMDFRKLNRACFKDCYPFLLIDQLVDSTLRYEFVYMLDSYQGYYQILLMQGD